MSDYFMALAGVIQKELSQLASVAQNAANTNTTGYKSVQQFSALAADGSTRPGPEAMTSVQQVRTHDGALKYTGQRTDMALSGDAWFALSTPDGLRLTRDGRFRLSADGVLLSATGHAVMGETGAIRLSSTDFTVSREGVITRDSEQLARIVLLSPEKPAQLVHEGNGLYRTTGEVGAPREFSLHQGMLEQSNVNLSAEMVRMMQTSRHIESMQRALSAYDSVLGTGINQIGKE